MQYIRLAKDDNLVVLKNELIKTGKLEVKARNVKLLDILYKVIWTLSNFIFYRNYKIVLDSSYQVSKNHLEFNIILPILSRKNG